MSLHCVYNYSNLVPTDSVQVVCGTPYQLLATQKKHDTLVEIVFELTAIVGSHTRLNLNQSQTSFKL